MQQRFPRDDELWRRQVEQLLMGLAVDRDRLWKMTPQIPDPEAGMAFTGPLSPYAFKFPAQHGASGSPASGTRPVSGAASGVGGTGVGTGSVNTGVACTNITCSNFGEGGQLQISGVTGPCASDFNGNFSDLVLDNSCDPRTYTRNGGLWIVSVAVTTSPSNNPVVTVTLSNGSGQVEATYSGIACPGQNSFLSLVSQSAAGACSGTSFSSATVQLSLTAA